MNFQDAKAFAQLLDLERFELDVSPWAQTQRIDDWLGALRSEIDELEEALRAKASRQKVTSELADVAGDAIKALICAERAGMTTVLEVLTEAYAKMVRRKPWIILVMKDHVDPPATIEEESEIWNREKDKERNKTPDEK